MSIFLQLHLLIITQSNFYCIKNNYLPCLRGIISKLEKSGLTIYEILKFRHKLRVYTF